ncbi:MAG TPA: FkbM family methyltransferase [Solirubrobacteraceae bacterium]|nr:FkbM family methyltransferase [Solirubrobacteraceae bacterium]
MTTGSGFRQQSDPLHLAARVTQALPDRVGAALGWKLGQRARRVLRVARLKTGGQLAVDVGDYLHRAIFFLGEWEPETTRLFRRLAHPGWTVIDVGANAGYFSVVAGSLGAPGSRVVAFEPNPQLGNMIAQSILLNPELDITLERAAGGDRAGMMALHMSPEDRNSGLSTLRADLYPHAPTLQVPVLRLDDYCTEHDLRPDLLKIDVEGFEAPVLRGAGWIIEDRVASWVVCEMEPDDPSELISFMRRRGYRCSRITESGDLAPFGGMTRTGNVCFSCT